MDSSMTESWIVTSGQQTRIINNVGISYLKSCFRVDRSPDATHLQLLSDTSGIPVKVLVNAFAYMRGEKASLKSVMSPGTNPYPLPTVPTPFPAPSSSVPGLIPVGSIPSSVPVAAATPTSGPGTGTLNLPGAISNAPISTVAIMANVNALAVAIENPYAPTYLPTLSSMMVAPPPAQLGSSLMCPPYPPSPPLCPLSWPSSTDGNKSALLTIETKATSQSPPERTAPTTISKNIPLLSSVEEGNVFPKPNKNTSLLSTNDTNVQPIHLSPTTEVKTPSLSQSSHSPKQKQQQQQNASVSKDHGNSENILGTPSQLAQMKAQLFSKAEAQRKRKRERMRDYRAKKKAMAASSAINVEIIDVVNMPETIDESQSLNISTDDEKVIERNSLGRNASTVAQKNTTNHEITVDNLKNDISKNTDNTLYSNNRTFSSTHDKQASLVRRLIEMVAFAEGVGNPENCNEPQCEFDASGGIDVAPGHTFIYQKDGEGLVRLKSGQ